MTCVVIIIRRRNVFTMLKIPCILHTAHLNAKPIVSAFRLPFKIFFVRGVAMRSHDLDVYVGCTCARNSSAHLKPLEMSLL